MSVHSATPYLILNGKAALAIPFYVDALEAKLESRQHFGDVDESCPEARRDLIMHAVLRVGEALIMLSDGQGEGPLPTAGIVTIALNLDDVEQAHRIFNALATGGKVAQPLIPVPWGALFGAVTDRFGVEWLFNCALSTP